AVFFDLLIDPLGYSCAAVRVGNLVQAIQQQQTPAFVELILDPAGWRRISLWQRIPDRVGKRQRGVRLNIHGQVTKEKENGRLIDGASAARSGHGKRDVFEQRRLATAWSAENRQVCR